MTTPSNSEEILQLLSAQNELLQRIADHFGELPKKLVSILGMHAVLTEPKGLFAPYSTAPLPERAEIYAKLMQSVGDEGGEICAAAVLRSRIVDEQPMSNKEETLRRRCLSVVLSSSPGRGATTADQLAMSDELFDAVSADADLLIAVESVIQAYAMKSVAEALADARLRLAYIRRGVTPQKGGGVA